MGNRYPVAVLALSDPLSGVLISVHSDHIHITVIVADEESTYGILKVDILIIHKVMIVVVVLLPLSVWKVRRPLPRIHMLFDHIITVCRIKRDPAAVTASSSVYPLTIVVLVLCIGCKPHTIGNTL